MVVVISGIQWEAELVGVHYRRIETWLVFLRFGYDIRRRSKICRNMGGQVHNWEHPDCLYFIGKVTKIWVQPNHLNPSQPSPSPIFSHKSKQHIQDHLQTQGVRIVHQFPQQLLENSYSCLKVHWMGFKGISSRRNHGFTMFQGKSIEIENL